MVEGDRVLAFQDKLLIEDVEHLKERRLRRNIVELIFLEMTFGCCVFLAPDFELYVHL